MAQAVPAMGAFFLSVDSAAFSDFMLFLAALGTAPALLTAATSTLLLSPMTLTMTCCCSLSYQAPPNASPRLDASCAMASEADEELNALGLASMASDFLSSEALALGSTMAAPTTAAAAAAPMTIFVLGTRL